ncbi:hypothetical protein SK3146_03225 [Paenibacillus konkukensis]|uniref:RNA polymerase sigma-70 region 4 domain-containing protein n=1 Tax=Paenibacillus konkukensis TaxID=2020716 RepID=A0ABY4RR83_9BACL|nr:sigma factor-like helix-turn-helix DNA-binding protein [Paenibacillus konkukensis]UQZ84013.1 hypothetical protein SK3146_03225 [Paenibacillus konkukensis]
MGKMKLDRFKDQRKYTDKYALIDAKGIALLLRDGHRIRERTYYAGDYAGVDILTDLNTAMQRAALTPRQAETIALVYGLDITLDAAGTRLGITKQAVKHAVTTATEKIASVFRQWNVSERESGARKEGEALGA